MARFGYTVPFIPMIVLMAIGAAIVIGIASVIVVLVIAIPMGALGLAAVLTGKAAGLTWNVQTITLAVVAGSIVLAFFFYILSLISVPAIVFFPAYSIYFFAARYPELAAFVYPAPPSPPEAPFSPPTMEPIG